MGALEATGREQIGLMQNGHVKPGVSIVNGDAEGKSVGLLNGNADMPQQDHSHASNAPAAAVGTGSHEDAFADRIAICGLAVRLPGGLHTPQQFWDFLVRKGDARDQVPRSRYNAASFYSEELRKGVIRPEHGYFLDESVDLGAFDSSLFSMSRAELQRVDPLQRQLLEVARECMEDAGEVAWAGKNIGCFVGSFGEDWCEMFAKEPQQYGMYRVGGTGDFMLSNRLSYEMDLRGPSVTVRTGCSAAMVALHQACQAIQGGDCESAVVGGANLILAPGMTSALTEQRVLSPDGSCKSFSADADGYARGEAINAVFVKPLRHAIRDGNPIRAVIRASAANSDGKTPGLSVPNADAQEQLMRHAYSRAGLARFDETAFIECHGTGTAVGDPIETDAVARVFGQHGVYIGSVKPNLGHSEGASGLTSLIKVVLALEHQTIPPNIKFTKPNPKIRFDQCKLVVPTEAVPWPKDRRERASINSFGIGGSNAHVILDSARSHGISDVSTQGPSTTHLLLYSAASAESLQAMARAYETVVRERRECLPDLAYTLANKREHLSHRAFSVVQEDLTCIHSQTSKIGQAPSLVMIFSGQGAQWPAMGRDLFLNNVVFRRSIQSLDDYLQRQTEAPGWTIEQELLKSHQTSRVHTAEFALPLSVVVQIALVDSLRAIGVTPDAVLGHSSGEIAAAYAAGALDAHEAIVLATSRGFATTSQKRAGAMAAVGMGWDQTQPFLVPGVSIACENSPSSVTISGDSDKINLVVKEIKASQPDVLARRLKVDQAYHSQHMADVSGAYYQLIESKVASKVPAKLFFSALRGRVLNGSESTGPRYWQENMESPVMFRAAVASLLQHPIGQDPVFLEIGPHSSLSGPLRQICAEAGRTVPYVPTMVRDQNSMATFLTAVGKLFQLNTCVGYQSLYPSGTCLPDLPRYPWNRSGHYWHESRLSEAWRHRQHPHHDLLGSRTLESSDIEPSWRNLLHLDNVSWIRDHKVQGNIILPFAIYIALSGEAARQITGIDGAFSVRRVVASTAMVMAENKPVELLTSLRRHRLTDAQDSQWWEFTVSSYNGNAWTMNCQGQVRAHASRPDRMSPPHDLPRAVESDRWYSAMQTAGLDYGSAFRRLRSITAHPLKDQATAGVISDSPRGTEQYHIHPAVIDACLQLLIVAATRGVPRKLIKTYLPTTVEELTISRCDTVGNLFASVEPAIDEEVRGRVYCVNGNSVVGTMTGLKLSPLGPLDTDSRNDKISTSRLHWSTHLDFMLQTPLHSRSVDRSEYGGLLDTLTWLCLVQTQREIQHAKPGLPYMEKYAEWTNARLMSTECPEDVCSGDTLARISRVVEALSTTPAKIAAIAMHKILKQVKAIFAGEVNPLEILLDDGTLSQLYDFMDQFDSTAFLRHLAHTKPNLRVLEVGGGAGATTANVLSNLISQDGQPAHSCYMFTDISSGFFPAAKERFSGVANMQYAVLDISKDPADQGFTENEFDLVIATNVLHATERLDQTLSHVRKLLHHEGRLLLQELTPKSKWANYIFGILPGWWLGNADGRGEEPYVSPDRWQAELHKSGFAGHEMMMLDSEEPFQLNAVMVARPRVERPVEKDIVVLCREKSTAPQNLLECLAAAGYSISLCELSEAPRQGVNVLAVVDEAGPIFDDLSSTNYDSLQGWMGNIGDSTMMWLTKPSQMRCDDPRYAPVLGAARSIRSELAVKLATCEVDSVDKSCEQILAVLGHILVQTGDSTLLPDFEYSIIGNQVFVGRYHPFSVEGALEIPRVGETKFDLNVGKKGAISSLQWVSAPLPSLAEDAVEIETKAFGINFRDVLGVLGVVPVSTGDLGIESAGIVRRTGSRVQDIAPGQRVMLLGPGSCSSIATTTGELCVRIPDEMTFNEAATMPCVYGTAIHCLMTVGKLNQGQSILIHSACGGVGLAALHVARMIGACVYVTVGNQQKVDHLIDNFGLSRDSIFNSRDESFVGKVMHVTEGHGVDLVLNSLSGELLHASWKCVAEFGTMVEIGKRDILGAGKLDMSPFLRNRSYCCVDLEDMCIKRPDHCKSLLTAMVEYYRQGHITPIRPFKVFGADAVQDAFKYMQQGQHIGKIIVSLSGDARISAAQHTTPGRKLHSQFDGSASYLLVGGLGGLGQAVAAWMVECGARDFIFLSRNAGSGSGDTRFIQELVSQGCRVHLVRGDVSHYADVERAFNSANFPVKGVMQMSMVLRDKAFAQMSFQDWTVPMLPKVQGTWNLHNASVRNGHNLDFFVLFSSLTGIVGLPGQANYNAGNTFLDAFASFRAGLGLAASTIDISAVEDVGYVAQNRRLLEKTKSTIPYTVREAELLRSLELAVLLRPVNGEHEESPSLIGVNNFVLGLCAPSGGSGRTIWRNDRRMAAYHNAAQSTTESSSAADGDLLSFLTSTREDPALLRAPGQREFLAIEIGKKLCDLLAKPESDLDIARPMSDLGMDSLVAIEMRSWWRKVFKVDITVLELLGLVTLQALGDHAADELLASFAGD